MRVERTAHIGDFTCIGSGTNVLDSAHVRRSVIGRRSYVGSNAHISDSFIMGGVTIGAGACPLHDLCMTSASLHRPMLTHRCLASRDSRGLTVCEASLQTFCTLNHCQLPLRSFVVGR